MPRPPVEVDIKVETKVLAQRVSRLKQYQKKGTLEAVRFAVLAFAQSAVKETPPKKERRKKSKGNDFPPKQKALTKRAVVEGIWVWRKTGWIRYDNGAPNTGHLHSGYAVPYRTARKSGIKMFKAKGKANKFAKIIYRNISKMGWVAAATKALGGSPKISKFRVSPEAKSKAFQVSEGTKRVSLFTTIRLKNKVLGIGGYGRYAVLFALRAANNRLRTTANRYKRELKKKWR